MTTKLKWGLIGTGAIARRFAQGLADSKTGELAAIGSRSQKAADSFAADFPARRHGSYEALLADPSVDAVYISTPHPHHAEWAIKAAEAGKHVLCEKPLTMHYSNARAVVEAARRNDVFLMEAFMYRCQPQTARLVELLQQRAVGEVRFVRAAFSFATAFDPGSRLFNPELGGGGILDVGCYCTSMARLVAGAVSGAAFEDPVEVKGLGRMGESGVDEFAIASLKFPCGLLAEVAAGLRLSLENTVSIVGTEGSIVVPLPWFAQGLAAGFSKIVLFRDGLPEEVVVEADRGIYAMEAVHVAEHLAARQSPMMSWADTLGNMRALDAWRADLG